MKRGILSIYQTYIAHDEDQNLKRWNPSMESEEKRKRYTAKEIDTTGHCDTQFVHEEAGKYVALKKNRGNLFFFCICSFSYLYN